jgi:hypothetical protein
MFENRVLRRIFGPKRNEVTGGWRKVHNDELQDLHSLPRISRIIKSRSIRLAGHVARMGEKKNVYKLLVRKPEGKRHLGRPKRRRIDNVTMDLLEISLSVVDWIGLVQNRYMWRALVNAVMNLRVPYNAGKLLSGSQLVASRVVFSSKRLVHSIRMLFQWLKYHSSTYLRKPPYCIASYAPIYFNNLADFIILTMQTNISLKMEAAAFLQR